MRERVEIKCLNQDFVHFVCPLAVQLSCSGYYICYLCWSVGWIVCLVFSLRALVQNFGIF